MVRKGFKMKLYPGMEAEYEKRHNELWPEMQDMIHEYGDQPQVVGFHGGHHGDEPGQQPGVCGSA